MKGTHLYALKPTNLVISRRFHAEYRKNMYWNACRTIIYILLSNIAHFIGTMHETLRAVFVFQNGFNSAPGSLYSFIFVSLVIFGGVDVASIVISKINGERLGGLESMQCFS